MANSVHLFFCGSGFKGAGLFALTNVKWTPYVGPRTVGIKVESRLCPFPLSSSSKTL